MDYNRIFQLFFSKKSFESEQKYISNLLSRKPNFHFALSICCVYDLIVLVSKQASQKKVSVSLIVLAKGNPYFVLVSRGNLYPGLVNGVIESIVKLRLCMTDFDHVLKNFKLAIFFLEVIQANIASDES